LIQLICIDNQLLQKDVEMLWDLQLLVECSELSVLTVSFF